VRTRIEITYFDIVAQLERREMAVRGRSMSVVRRSYEEPPLSPREWVKLGFGLSESRQSHCRAAGRPGSSST
jgi:hypothetical protein